ncbi:MAG: glycosyltransferase family 4 protein [Pseudomonadota bacterium]
MEITSIRSEASERAIRGPRVLFVLPSLGAGGSERVVTTLANHWASEDRPVGIANFDAPDFEPFYPLAEQVDLFRLHLPPGSGGLAAQMRQTGHRIKALEEVYRQFRPDVVISFLTKTNIMALVAANASGVPVIISERNNPNLQTFNAFWRIARSRVYPKAFSFVTMTRGAAEYYPKKQRPRTRIIPNPVNLPEGWQKKRQGNTITAVGRLAEQKQFHLLIEAFAKIAPDFPSWNLTIWGEGGLRGDLEAQRAKVGLETRINLPGLTDVPGQWVETADVLAMSSAYEGWPNVIVEGMAAELPVVTFDCEHGPADMIEDGVTGLLVPQDNVPALSEALAKVLGDPDLRKSLAERAGEASARYDTHAIADQWMAIVEEAVSAD